MLIWSIYEHQRSPLLLVFSHSFFFSTLMFTLYKSFVSVVKFIPVYRFLSSWEWNFSLLPVSASLLLVYKKAIGFFVCWLFTLLLCWKCFINLELLEQPLVSCHWQTWIMWLLPFLYITSIFSLLFSEDFKYFFNKSEYSRSYLMLQIFSLSVILTKGFAYISSTMLQ